MENGVVGAFIGIGGLVVLNGIILSFFYGKLCGKVEANTWKIAQLWRRVFNNNPEEVDHVPRNK